MHRCHRYSRDRIERHASAWPMPWPLLRPPPRRELRLGEKYDCAWGPFRLEVYSSVRSDRIFGAFPTRATSHHRATKRGRPGRFVRGD